MILRPATVEDAQAIGALHHHTMRTSLPFLPDLHTKQETVAFVETQVLPANIVWLAEADGEVAGYIAFDAEWIHHLYVHPTRQGQGIGPVLVAKALADSRPRQLWTFQANGRARRFYEARGFTALRFTDGACNEERTPDVLYEWRP